MGDLDETLMGGGGGTTVWLAKTSSSLSVGSMYEFDYMVTALVSERYNT